MKILNHKNNRYILESKYIDTLYNISHEDIRMLAEKLSKQEYFLHKNKITFADGTEKSYFDLNMSANIRPDLYIPEISNRVWSMYNWCHDNVINMVPVFLTMTPPTEFKPTRQAQVKGRKNLYVVKDNPEFSGDFDNYVKDCRESLSNRWRSMMRVKLFNRFKLHYFSVYEPFIDGALHRHTMAFVPRKYLEQFIDTFKTYFGSTSHDVKHDFSDNGAGAIRYVMKYIVKSIVDLRSGESFKVALASNPATAWYVKHSIRRITTSRTLLPLYLWRSSDNSGQTMQDMTDDYRAGLIQYDFIQRDPLNPDTKRSAFKVGTITQYTVDCDGNIFDAKILKK